MSKLVIATCTYQRQAGLRTLLAALSRLRIVAFRACDVVVLIVDNSQDESARGVFSEFAKVGPFETRYVCEHRKGIANARNAALAYARSLEATHLAFIDDDEVPERDWLDHLLIALADTGAAAAVGPVYPLFLSVPGRLVPARSYLVERPHSGGLATEGHSCNCLIDLHALRSCNLRFDTRFNETGAEDTDYFQKIRDNGFQIAWADDAIVHEFVPPDRMRPRWLLRRWYRTGNTDAARTERSASIAGRGISLGKGVLRIAAGSTRMLFAAMFQSWRQPSRLTESCYTLCRGLGFVAHAFGRSYKEYSLPTYR